MRKIEMSAIVSEVRLGETARTYVSQALKDHGEVIEAKGAPARQARIVTAHDSKSDQVDLVFFELRGQMTVFQTAVKVGFREVKSMFPRAAWIAWNPAWQ